MTRTKIPPASIVVRPSISNTDTITGLRTTTPASKFSMVENPILYGGSTRLELSSTQKLAQFFSFMPSGIAGSVHIELYVLNSCFIFWFSQYNQGVEVGYRSLILHALTNIDNENCIYLQIEGQNTTSDGMDNTFEFYVKEGGGLKEINELFQELDLQDIIKDTYEAFTVCTSFHADPSSPEDEYSQNSEVPMLPSISNPDDFDDVLLIRTDHNNIADDLNNDDVYDDEINGGMIVDVGIGSVLGKNRSRVEEDNDNEKNKNRKLN